MITIGDKDLSELSIGDTKVLSVYNGDKKIWERAIIRLDNLIFTEVYASDSVSSDKCHQIAIQYSTEHGEIVGTKINLSSLQLNIGVNVRQIANQGMNLYAHQSWGGVAGSSTWYKDPIINITSIGDHQWIGRHLWNANCKLYPSICSISDGKIIIGYVQNETAGLPSAVEFISIFSDSNVYPNEGRVYCPPVPIT